MHIHPELVTLMAAELIFLLVRSPDILILVKSARQRSNDEQHRIERGLARGIVVEALIFAPASAFLLILLAPFLLPDRLINISVSASYAALGVISYGFPFATIRRVVTLVALNTLSEFARLAPPPMVRRLVNGHD